MTPSDYNSKQDLINSPHYNAPHVVLLGAGASKAACQEGDGNDQLVPLMNELPSVLGDTWRNLVENVPGTWRGFEAQFTWLRNQSKYQRDLENVEQLIHRHFQNLKLPDHATIYDHLVLGLRRKDIIATFNWDPFLMLAHRRNRDVADLPDIRFLHGCVSHASCPVHDVLGVPGEQCPKCGDLLVGGVLLFPDQEKDYTEDTLVSRDWRAVTDRLKKAFHLTIFGYSGPSTDHLAKELILEQWRKSRLHQVGHVEIIDISPACVLRRNWQSFIPFHHEMIVSSFWDSIIAKWPRRTAEYKLGASLYATPSEQIGPYRTDSLEELQQWHLEIALAESSEM